MNTTQLKKLNELETQVEKWNVGNAEALNHDQYMELMELQFIRNKSNINFRLSGNNKYYYANQCQKFYGNLKKYLEKSSHDFDLRQLERLKKEGICFNKYSINIGYNQYCEDYKRFNSTQELLGFVIGFNQAMNSWSN